jgi:hypothetical protein
MNLNELQKPGEFHKRNPRVFRTYSALRKYLDKRHENGLITSGAVIETPLGLRIDAAKFEAWMLGRTESAA